MYDIATFSVVLKNFIRVELSWCNFGVSYTRNFLHQNQEFRNYDVT
jgi:hypothetical protein